MPLLMCPNCNLSMQSINRSSVEFDMCPNCRGVWLDRGELEKIITEVQAAMPAPAPGTGPAFGEPAYGQGAQPAYGQGQPDYRQPDYDRRYRRDDDDGDRYDDDRRGRRRGFSLFDIFD